MISGKIIEREDDSISFFDAPKLNKRVRLEMIRESIFPSEDVYFYAIRNNDVELMREVMKQRGVYSCDDRRRNIQLAASEGFIELVEIMVEYEADINEAHPYSPIAQMILSKKMTASSLRVLFIFSSVYLIIVL